MSNRDRVLAYLRSVAPAGATNAEIVAGTGIKPHQQVFMITRNLVQQGAIKGVQAGKAWTFWSVGRRTSSSVSRATPHDKADDTPPGRDTEAIELRLGMKWRAIGRVTLATDGRLVFPAVRPEPGVYRFRIEARGKKSVYVGETDNIARRFSHYRNPGPTQQTNLRINTNFRKALAAGAEIAVDIVVSGAWIGHDGERKAADLGSKVVRCLFENAAMLENKGLDVDSLNRSAT